MVVWLDAVKRAAAGSCGDTPDGIAVIFGDYAGRATRICLDHGMVVIRPWRLSGEPANPFPGDPRVIEVGVTPERLPFRNRSINLVVLQSALEFIHDDRQVIRDVARVLVPGGEVVARVPAQNGLSGIDTVNLACYAKEVSGRGRVPVETLPLGWRRHYRPEDIDAVFAGSGLAVTNHRTTGFALGEAAFVIPTLLAGVLDGRTEIARRVRKAYARQADIDERGRGAAWRVVVATKPAARRT